MNFDNASIVAFGAKVGATLGEATAKIYQFEADAKRNMAQGELDALRELKSITEAISKKQEDWKAAGEEKAAQIEADIVRLLTSLQESIEAFKKNFKVKPNLES